MIKNRDVELKPDGKYLYLILLCLPMCPPILEKTIFPEEAMALKNKMEEAINRLPKEARDLVDFQFWAVDLEGLIGEIPSEGNPCKELLPVGVREDGQLDVGDEVKDAVAAMLANFNPEGKAN